jgi:hypothetical protein
VYAHGPALTLTQQQVEFNLPINLAYLDFDCTTPLPLLHFLAEPLHNCCSRIGDKTDSLHRRDPVQYLPPPGAHYDQHDIKRIFDELHSVTQMLSLLTARLSRL